MQIISRLPIFGRNPNGEDTFVKATLDEEDGIALQDTAEPS